MSKHGDERGDRCAAFILGCNTGGYAAGSLGLMLGTLGNKQILNGCVDTATP